MAQGQVIRVMRGLISELRHNCSERSLKDSLLIKYIFKQYRKHKVTDKQVCKASEEMKFVSESYLCYLKSKRKYEELHNQYHGKGERSVEETAKIVGFKLPHDPK